MTGHDFAGLSITLFCFLAAAVMVWFVRGAALHADKHKLSPSEASFVIFLGTGATVSFTLMGLMCLGFVIRDLT